VPYADCYRCHFRSIPSCGIACAEVARKYVKVATGCGRRVIVEPMQAPRNIVPPKEFLPAMKTSRRKPARCHRDEMITASAAPHVVGHRPHGVIPHRQIGKPSAAVPTVALATTDAIGVAKPWSTAPGRRRATAAIRSRRSGAASLRIIETKTSSRISRVGAVMLKELETWSIAIVRRLRARLGMFMALDSSATRSPRPITA